MSKEHVARVIEGVLLRMSLDRDMGYLHGVIRSMDLVFDNVRTSATDGVSLFIGEEFFMGLTPEQTAYVLIHEALHKELGHHLRRDGRLPGMWNLAADAVVEWCIRPLVRRSSRSKWDLEGWLEEPNVNLVTCEKLGVPTNICAEQIYDILMSRKKQEKSRNSSSKQNEQCGGGGDGEKGGGQESGGQSSGQLGKQSGDQDKAPGQSAGDAGEDVAGHRDSSHVEDMPMPDFGECIDCPDPTMTETRANMERTEIVRRSEQAGGRVPPRVEDARMATKKYDSLQEWRTILNEKGCSAISGAREVRSWHRYGRASNETFKFPHKMNVSPKLVLVVDNSGSMSEKDIAECATEVISIKEQTGCDMKVLFSDTEVRNEMTNPDDVDEIVRVAMSLGRGGTLFVPAICRAMEDSPDAIIYLTDGIGGDGHIENPGVPFIWVLVDGITKVSANFGEIVTIPRRARYA